MTFDARTRVVARGLSMALCLVLALLVPVGGVAADDARVREARVWFERGLAASREGAFTDAVNAFEHSRALAERPSVLQNLAVALDRLGRVSEALAVLDRAIELGVSSRDAKRVDDFKAELLGKVAEVTFEVTPAGASVELDGRVLSAPWVRCDAGKHTLRVTMEGHESERRELVLGPGTRRVERIVLGVTPPEPTEPVATREASPAPVAPVRERNFKPWAFGMLATGIALAGTGTAAWVLAGQDQNAWEKRCAKEVCSPDERASEQRQIDRLDRTSFALLGLAGASAVCATTLFVLHGREQKRPVSVSAGPRSVHLSVRF